MTFLLKRTSLAVEIVLLKGSIDYALRTFSANDRVDKEKLNLARHTLQTGLLYLEQSCRQQISDPWQLFGD